MATTQSYKKELQGVSIIPLKENGYFNTRRLASPTAPLAVKVTKAVLATGQVATEKDGRFWLQVTTPTGLAWVRSDVASWQGKVSSKSTAATGGRAPSGTLVAEFLPAFKGATIAYLANAPRVTIRKGPGLEHPKLRTAIRGPIHRTIGTASGNVRRYSDKSVKYFWIELEAPGGWVRSDVVHHQGAQSTGARLAAKTGEAVKDVATFAGSTAMAAIQPLLVPIGLGLAGLYLFTQIKKAR